ncbi:AraC family transcriptional regulator [Paenibacillus anaericanus]|uniref:AraC family transcriptional regulator n=1 Tax=Paenibacillus anaericanus TaxID=170367 RepID=A0A3S1K6T3_9BACL|nr:AraC family transcriptional regulator [Paenibacillus anaericanus]RUT45209.1 AraC family transcriptional regulator [Paenibacillus anaericanus]
MNYMECFQKSIDFIEEQLTEKITVETLAGIAGFSPDHFYKLFHVYVGMPVMEYVRTRRLAHAVVELSTNKKIIDIAMEYGFETHSGFCKAFRKVYGCSPENYRKYVSTKVPGKVNLALYEKLNLYGGIILEPKFITKPAFNIVGYALETTFEESRSKRDIPAFWNHFDADGLEQQLYEQLKPEEHGEYCVCFPPNMETGAFTYVIGVKVENFDNAKEEMFKGSIPEATYAVFTTPPADYADCAFAKAIEGTAKYIFEEWFPDSGYEFAPGKVDYEFYDERCHDETGAVMEIHIPVVKSE